MRSPKKMHIDISTPTAAKSRCGQVYALASAPYHGKMKAALTNNLDEVSCQGCKRMHAKSIQEINSVEVPGPHNSPMPPEVMGGPDQAFMDDQDGKPEE